MLEGVSGEETTAKKSKKRSSITMQRVINHFAQGDN